jgi:hypothetical protein
LGIGRPAAKALVGNEKHTRLTPFFSIIFWNALNIKAEKVA